MPCLLTSFQVQLRCSQIPTTLSDSKSLLTSLLEVMISSKNELSLFVIWMSLLDNPYSMLDGLLWMWVRSVLLLGRIVDMHHLGAFIWIAELRRPAALSSYYGLWSRSSPTIRTWDQLNGETHAGKSAHREVDWIDRVRGCWIDQLDSQWSSTGHSVEGRNSWDYNSKFANDIHCWLWLPSYIECVIRKNAPNWQLRTS